MKGVILLIKIDVLQTGPLSVNTYIAQNTDTKECIVVDPAAAKPVLGFLNEYGLKCTHILLTHGHFDHIMGVAELKKKTGAKVYIHEADAEALKSDKVNLSVFLGMEEAVEKCEADTELKDGDKINALGIEISVMHTPGHSRGSVCYVMESERTIFSGDTLFHLSVGRADLYLSDKNELARSILYKLYMLHGNYRVLPGHEEETELEYEKLNNPVTNNMVYDC